MSIPSLWPLQPACLKARCPLVPDIKCLCEAGRTFCHQEIDFPRQVPGVWGNHEKCETRERRNRRYRSVDDPAGCNLDFPWYRQADGLIASLDINGGRRPLFRGFRFLRGSRCFRRVLLPRSDSVFPRVRRIAQTATAATPRELVQSFYQTRGEISHRNWPPFSRGRYRARRVVMLVKRELY
jgi:hypothetical protein